MPRSVVPEAGDYLSTVQAADDARRSFSLIAAGSWSPRSSVLQTDPPYSCSVLSICLRPVLRMRKPSRTVRLDAQ